MRPDPARAGSRPYGGGMTIDDIDDLDGLRLAGRAVAEARDTMLAAVEPGITTGELDDIGRDALRRHGAQSAPRLAYSFPGATCISVNSAAAHGIPSYTCVLRDGDLVNIDVSAELDGYWADTGASAPVGIASPEVRHLLDATLAARDDAIAAARAGEPMRMIGRAVERRAQREGLTVIANLAGHGVGRFIHEEPSISNVENRRDRTKLWDGLVIAIEPFLSTGADEVFCEDDGWTLSTPDGSLPAQFEHTVVITGGEALVLT